MANTSDSPKAKTIPENHIQAENLLDNQNLMNDDSQDDTQAILSVSMGAIGNSSNSDGASHENYISDGDVDDNGNGNGNGKPNHEIDSPKPKKSRPTSSIFNMLKRGSFPSFSTYSKGTNAKNTNDTNENLAAIITNDSLMDIDSNSASDFSAGIDSGSIVSGAPLDSSTGTNTSILTNLNAAEITPSQKSRITSRYASLAKGFGLMANQAQLQPPQNQHSIPAPPLPPRTLSDVLDTSKPQFTIQKLNESSQLSQQEKLKSPPAAEISISPDTTSPLAPPTPPPKSPPSTAKQYGLNASNPVTGNISTRPIPQPQPLPISIAPVQGNSGRVVPNPGISAFRARPRRPSPSPARPVQQNLNPPVNTGYIPANQNPALHPIPGPSLRAPNQAIQNVHMQSGRPHLIHRTESPDSNISDARSNHSHNSNYSNNSAIQQQQYRVPRPFDPPMQQIQREASPVQYQAPILIQHQQSYQQQPHQQQQHVRPQQQHQLRPQQQRQIRPQQYQIRPQQQHQIRPQQQHQIRPQQQQQIRPQQQQYIRPQQQHPRHTQLQQVYLNPNGQQLERGPSAGSLPSSSSQRGQSPAPPSGQPQPYKVPKLFENEQQSFTVVSGQDQQQPLTQDLSPEKKQELLLLQMQLQDKLGRLKPQAQKYKVPKLFENEQIEQSQSQARASVAGPPRQYSPQQQQQGQLHDGELSNRASIAGAPSQQYQAHVNSIPNHRYSVPLNFNSQQNSTYGPMPVQPPLGQNQQRPLPRPLPNPPMPLPVQSMQTRPSMRPFTATKYRPIPAPPISTIRPPNNSQVPLPHPPHVTTSFEAPRSPKRKPSLDNDTDSPINNTHLDADGGAEFSNSIQIQAATPLTNSLSTPSSPSKVLKLDQMFLEPVDYRQRTDSAPPEVISPSISIPRAKSTSNIRDSALEPRRRTLTLISSSEYLGSEDDATSEVSSTVSSSHSYMTQSMSDTRPTFTAHARERNAKLPANISMQYIEALLERQRAEASHSRDPKVLFEFSKSLLASGEVYYDEGFALLRRVAGCGFAEAHYFLGEAYADDGKYALAYSQFLCAAKRGNTEGCHAVAALAEVGRGCKRNTRLALEMYTRAAMTGSIPSMYRLGLAEMYGHLKLKKDIVKAAKWFKRAANVPNRKYPEPLLELAKIYETGVPPYIIQDFAYARGVLQEAVDFGYPPALYKLGYSYEHGLMGYEINPSESMRLYTFAMQAGYLEAFLGQAGWHMTGVDGILPQDQHKSYILVKEAADRGLARAQYTVGHFLEGGIGTEMDLTEAFRYYTMAAQQGEERAIERLGKANRSVDTSGGNGYTSNPGGGVNRQGTKRSIFRMFSA